MDLFNKAMKEYITKPILRRRRNQAKAKKRFVT